MMGGGTKTPGKHLRAEERGIADGTASKSCLGGWRAFWGRYVGFWGVVCYSDCLVGRMCPWATWAAHPLCKEMGKLRHAGDTLQKGQTSSVPQCSPTPALAGSNHSSLLNQPSHTFKNQAPRRRGDGLGVLSSQAALCPLTDVSLRVNLV